MRIDIDAIAKLESDNNQSAVSERGAIGVCQITMSALADWNVAHKSDRHTMCDLFDPKINRKIADWYLNERIPQLLGALNIPVTLENVLIAYVAGIGRLMHGTYSITTQKYVEAYITLEANA